jgi:hypothetical protein
MLCSEGATKTHDSPPCYRLAVIRRHYLNSTIRTLVLLVPWHRVLTSCADFGSGHRETAGSSCPVSRQRASCRLSDAAHLSLPRLPCSAVMYGSLSARRAHAGKGAAAGRMARPRWLLPPRRRLALSASKRWSPWRNSQVCSPTSFRNAHTFRTTARLRWITRSIILPPLFFQDSRRTRYPIAALSLPFVTIP